MPEKRRAEEDPERNGSQPQKSRKRRNSTPLQGGWTLSTGVGGCILNIEPVFSTDGESILVAYSNAVRVFSTKSVLLLRTLDVDVARGEITGIALSATEPNELFISTAAGRLEKWNWTSGNRVNSFDLGRSVLAISTIHGLPDDNYDVVSTVETAGTPGVHESSSQGNQAANNITLHALSKNSLHTIRNRVYKCHSQLHHLKVLQGGKFIIATCKRRLVVGKCQREISIENLENISYTWHELDTPGEITCLDIRIRDPQSSSYDVDIAIGTASGPVHFYHNLISKLKKIARKQERFQSSVQKLHWHRYAVGALRFSKDGNYLISGGQETVLCSWQLDTGKRQDLPHLTASIENLVVSPNGASYAILLGNNSLIILSTLDFKPTFAVTGPGWPAINGKKAKSIRYPAAIIPNSIPAQLMLATPSSTLAGQDDHPKSAVYLQTLDTRNGLQLQKQALTRTNATDKMTSPQGYLINEPNVSHMAINKSGNWLATVESWTPPKRDQNAASGSYEQLASAKSRSEIFLKFWSRNEGSKSWELSTRIDNPHAENPLDSTKILDLVATATGFASVGMDSRIRVWNQQNRRRNNIQIKNKEGLNLTNWVCYSSLSLPPPPVVDDISSSLDSAKIAVSVDGSLLVAALKYRDATAICMINTNDNVIVSTRNDLTLRLLHGIAIVDRYLIILSEHLLVWDIIEDRLHFSYKLKCASLPAEMLAGVSHLVADDTGKFAVAVPNGSGEKTQIAIFDPESPNPLCVHQINNLTTGLFSVSQGQGFAVMSNHAQVHRLYPPNATMVNVPESDDLQTLPGSNFTSQEEKIVHNGLTAATELEEEDENADFKHPVSDLGVRITQAKLAGIFQTNDLMGQERLKGMVDNIAELAIGRVFE